MGALGNLMQGQERALREQKVGEQSIYSNALLEGQQSQEMENARLEAIERILKNADGSEKNINDLTAIERQRLIALGYDVNANVPVKPKNVIQASQEQTQASPQTPGGATQSWMNLLSGLFG
jgi:hypothetical protein